MTYWRILSKPEELLDIMSQEKIMEKCRKEKKIFVGSPQSFKSFKENIKIDDIFITYDKEGNFYVGKIKDDCKQYKTHEDIHCREVEWLGDGKGLPPKNRRLNTCERLSDHAQNEIDLIESIQSATTPKHTPKK